MSEVVATPVSVLVPGPIAVQAMAIARHLQEVFPPSYFQFKYLPPSIGSRQAWTGLTQGNQPFLGLGLVGMKATGENANAFSGIVQWLLLVAVRAVAEPKVRLLGDAQGPGAPMLAIGAVAALHGRLTGSGALLVKGVKPAVSEAWADDATVMAVDLEVPLTVSAADVVSKPSGLGIFEELATTWNFPTSNGSIDAYSSDWKNPND